MSCVRCLSALLFLVSIPILADLAPLDRALTRAQLTLSDLTIEADIKARDPFRLDWIDRLLSDPTQFPPYTQKLAQTLANSLKLKDLVALAPEVLETKATTSGPLPADIALADLPRLLAGVCPSSHRAAWAEVGKKLASKASAFPTELANAVAVAAVAVAKAQAENENLFPRSWPSEKRQWFTRYALALARMSRGVENGVPLEEEWFKAAQEVNLVGVLHAAETLAVGADALRLLLEKYRQSLLTNESEKLSPEEKITSPVRKASPKPVLDLPTPAGRFLVGGTGDDTYDKPGIALVIELGGRDRYLAPVGLGVDGIGLSVDVAGGDVYQATENYAFGAGLFGAGLLMDLEGRDRYVVHDHSLGAGIFGVGLLLDCDGDDTYLSAVGGEGSGLFGLGALVDEAGNDLYLGGMFAQGVGHAKGLGLLLDRQGHDTYTLGGIERGWSASVEYHMSGGQGFGCGLREYASGGLGFLVDLGGNDRYQSGASAQGAGYWYSLGAVVDVAGNDVYQCLHYGQATAFHYALGMLWDLAGNDRYLGGCATQAGSWDGGVSVFLDQAGDDYYEGSGITNGGAAVTSLAIFLDHGGNDVYRVSPSVAMGGAEFEERRGWGSVGVFIDSGGKDQYTEARYANNTFWLQGDRGVGVDEEDPHPLWVSPFDVKPVAKPAGSASARTQTDIPKTPEGARKLFELYSDWQVKQEDKAKYAQQMRDMVELMIPVLTDALKAKPYRLTWGGAYQAFPELGEAAVPALLQLAIDADDNTRARAIDCLGRIDDPRVAAPLRKALGDPSFWVRSAATQALARRKDSESVDALIGLLKDDRFRVRVFAARALSGLADPKAVLPLAAMFADPHFGPREAAARALGNLGFPAAPVIEATFAKGGPSDRALAVMAAGVWIGWDPAKEGNGSLVSKGTVLVIAGLADPEPAVRSAALDACEAAGGKPAFGQLKEALARASATESVVSLKWRSEQLLPTGAASSSP